MIFLLIACRGNTPAASAPTPQPLAETIILYEWEDEMPQAILDAFTEEYGVNVTYVSYEDQESAIETIKAGEEYDVVVLNNEFIPGLAAEGLLAKIDYQNVPNIKNIAANFRDLAYDPGNRYSIPYNWGTTGLIVRTDLIDEPVTRWIDLWDPRYTGKIGLYSNESRTGIALALKSLGYSINSENPAELKEATAHLMALDRVTFTDEGSASLLLEDQAVIALGFTEDAREGQAENPAISYVLPKEGSILWGDNFTIPSGSQNKHTAEVFLNFLLRPDINAQITNETSYATANEAAYPFIDKIIINDPMIFPANEDLIKAEILLPISSEGEALYTEIWEEFLATHEQ